MRIDVMMGNPKAVEIVKAGAVGNTVPCDVVLTISGEPDEKMSLTEARAFYEQQAALVYDALRNSLPGGTFDELLVLMMKSRASLFRIPLFEQEG